jgi:hypothetical protein
MGEEEAPIKAGSIPISDPEKTTLNDFVNQDVIYQGKIGKLVTNLDGGFSVEVNENGKISQYDINVSGKNVKDGTMNIVKAGLSPITAAELTGQVTQIAGQTINARFLDKSERTAEINGVKYSINRDATGAIISLTYNTNDKAIAETQKEIDELNKEINDLKKEPKNKINTREITTKTFEVNKLISKKSELINKNKRRTRRGGNTDDLIFALNRLPNRFQKQVPSGEPTDREDQVKMIAQLSESESVTKEIDRILFEHGMPKDVENIIDGKVDDLTSAKKRNLDNWGIELIIKLEEYQSRLANEQRSTVPVDNIIEAVNELLNNIATIKFNKNGKISKKSIKEFAKARAKVQQGTNVSPIQKSTGAATEGVSGQAVSREDLTKLIQESRQRIQGIEIGEAPIEDELLQNIRSEIEGFFDEATLENIQELYNDAVLKFIFGAENLQGAYTDILSEVYTDKLTALMEDMSLDNLTEDTILVNKEPFGTFKNINEVFLVESLNPEEKTVTLYSPKRKKSYTFTDDVIKNNFMKPVDEVKPAEEINITPQVKENIKSTTDNVQDLVKDSERLDKIEEDSKNQSKDQRLANIRNKFNQC